MCNRMRGEGVCIIQWSYEPCCLYRATQDGQVTVKSSDKTWSTGGGNGNPLQYSRHKNLLDSMKRQKDVTPEDKLPRLEGVQRSWSWPVVWKPTRPSRTNTKNICPFHHRGEECKSRKSRDSWSNRQVWPWSTKWSTAKANRVLSREHTDHSKDPFPTTQDSTHGHHQMLNTEIILIIFFAVEDG